MMNRRTSGPAPHLLLALGQYLRQLREGRGWTLEQAARRVGLSPSSIAMAETGRRRPSAKALEAIALTYNVNVRALLIKAGLLDEREPFVPVLLIDWGFNVMLSDPEFGRANVVGAQVNSFEVRAYALDLYQRLSGRRLLRQVEYEALRKWLGIAELNDVEDSEDRLLEEMERICKRHPTIDRDVLWVTAREVWRWWPPRWGKQPLAERNSSDSEEEFLAKDEPDDSFSS